MLLGQNKKETGTGGWSSLKGWEESRGPDPEKADTQNKCNLPPVKTNQGIGITENAVVEEEDGRKGEVF